jgi:LmbE family N-acetylglucosaminyl deacetylase
MKNIFSHASYTFIFGHPDDEMYSTALIKNLVTSGKRVTLIYVTSGNRQGDNIGLLREKEATRVAEILGVSKNRLYLLHITEREVKLHLEKILAEIKLILRANDTNCVITHDHEGGHSVHDFTSFCGYKCARTVGADLWVFPAYHNQPHKRVINTFIGTRHADLRLELSPEQAALKTKIINTHITQRKYFENLSEIGMTRLLKREIFRYVEGDVDYTIEPTVPVGFDFKDSPTRLTDFLAAIKRIR